MNEMFGHYEKDEDLEILKDYLSSLSKVISIPQDAVYKIYNYLDDTKFNNFNVYSYNDKKAYPHNIELAKDIINFLSNLFNVSSQEVAKTGSSLLNINNNTRIMPVFQTAGKIATACSIYKRYVVNAQERVVESILESM